VDFFQRRHIRAGEYFINLIELRIVRYLFRRVLILNKVETVLLLILSKIRRGFARDIPPIKEIERRINYYIK